MITQAPRARAIFVAVAFALACFGLTIFVWGELGGSLPLQPKGYRFHVLFPEANQLNAGADVRISGISVGKVVHVAQRGTRADATIQIAAQYAPVPVDMRALLREKTLLGETFVALTPGSRSAPKLPENGTLAPGQVMQRQALDQVLNAFDPSTQRRFKALLRSTAQALAGRSQDLNAALGNADPAVTSIGRLMIVLDHQRGDVQRLVRDSGTVLRTLGDRRGDLQTLVRAGEGVLSATASRDRSLTATVRGLPPFLGQLRSTLRALDRTGVAARPALAALRPVAPLVPPALSTLISLAPRLDGLLRQLGPFLDLSERALPAATALLRASPPLARALLPAAQQLVPLIDYIAQYRREVIATFANFSSAMEATAPSPQGDLHYLRSLIPITNESVVGYGSRPQSNRHNPYFSPGLLNRIGHGGLEASDCRNATSGQPVPVIGGGSAPPCVVQPPWTFRGHRRFFQHVTPAR